MTAERVVAAGIAVAILVAALLIVVGVGILAGAAWTLIATGIAIGALAVGGGVVLLRDRGGGRS